MKQSRHFFIDEDARIPFSVIGIFLLLGSSVTTVYIARLEFQKSVEIVQSLDFNEVENLLRYAEADMTTAVNLAGMKALKKIGQTPIINAAWGTAEEMNQYRVKKIIQEELNVYFTGHYLYDTFTNGRYAINVILYNETPIPSPDNITINTLEMQLDRLTIPYIGPQQTINHTTYWSITVPVDLEIRKTTGDTSTLITTKHVALSSLLTSRYPLLECLVNEYNHTINGTFSSLWTFTTVFSNIYSLIRGYKHWGSGTPTNVVDNAHLALIVNSGLLLEQSLVFSSADPLALIELACHTKKTLKQQPTTPLSTFNEEMEGEGYDVNTDTISQGSANVDAGDDINQSINDCPSINLSEIAERILYNITSVTLQFENELGGSGEELIVFDGDVEQKIRDAVQWWGNQSYFLVGVMKHLEQNGTTFHFLSTIASEIYQDEMYMKVIDRHIAEEILGDPGEGWNNGGAGAWNYIEFIPLSKRVIKPEKGFIEPGCSLYEELYNIAYQRTHYWWRMEEQNISGNITLVKVWNNVTDSLIETVTLQILLSKYAFYGETENDIVDVLYYNITLDDPNLEDTLATYVLLYPDTDLLKQQMIITRDNQGAINLDALIPGHYNLWVVEESWDAFDTILDSIGEIILDPSINATNYPNPLVLLEKAKTDLQTKYEAQINEYLNISQYHTGSEFLSVGKKVVYCAREWFASKVKDDIEIVFSCLIEQLEEQIGDSIPSDVGFETHDITETLDTAGDALRNQFTIPFGFDINLTRKTDEGSLWSETVRLAVDQYPNYLDPFEKTECNGEELWTMKLRNRCTLGPTGVPILPPTPVTPWLLTLNVWVIDVEGEYAQLKVIDASDETVFNPLLGHEPQVYVREVKVVTVANTTLGENTRLTFRFTTVAFGVVPPWGMMVGDFQENWFDDHTPGYNEEE